MPQSPPPCRGAGVPPANLWRQAGCLPHFLRGLLVLFLLPGCAAVRPRAQAAARFLDLGLTTSARPQLSVDLCVLGILPIRVGATLDARFHGLAGGTLRAACPARNLPPSRCLT